MLYEVITGREDVRIVLSGGINAKDVYELRDIVDVFGVGTSIAGAPPIDFSLDIVEKEGKFVAKRGKRSGMKQVYRDWETLEDEVKLYKDAAPEGKEPLVKKYMEKGKIVRECNMEEARKLSLRQMEIIRKLGRVEEFVFG